MISVESLPQALKDNVTHVEFPEHPINKCMAVEFKNGLAASVITGPGTYGGKLGLYELAVIGLDGDVWEECPATEAGGISGWLNDEDLVALLAEVSEIDNQELRNARHKADLQGLELLYTATQFGVLRLFGLDENDDPFEYIDGTAEEREALGLSADASQALNSLTAVYTAARDKVNGEFLRGDTK